MPWSGDLTLSVRLCTWSLREDYDVDGKQMGHVRPLEFNVSPVARGAGMFMLAEL